MAEERETWADQVARLEMMARGGGDWDLSWNDRAAIRAALDKLKAGQVDEYRARLLQVAAKALKHRKKAETDGAARVAYDFCANEYLDALLAELLPPGRLLPLVDT